MGRLATLKPLLAQLPPNLGTVKGYVSQGDPKARNDARVGSEPWRRWYRTKRWQRIRLQVLIRDCWTCQRCKLIISRKGAAHVDHVTPHHGDPVKFWAGPFQVLCIECHARKRVEERATHWLAQ